MTQGIVTIRKNGVVRFKCIAGSDGMQAKDLKNELEKYTFDELSVELLFNLCEKVKFGSIDYNLVIQKKRYGETKVQVFHRLKDEEIVQDSLYYNESLFKNPEFNPRWECGLAEHTLIVNY